ncbi:MAG: type II toxin-antitoxin system PemK/MazF family toxin [bacterium]
MEKDFDSWNEKKKIISNLNNLFYHEREIWWCHLGINVGFEQDGKGSNFLRPILIIKGFSKNVLLCVPLTTKSKQGKYYSEIVLGDGLSRRVILSQLKMIDSKRLREKICMIDEEQFKKIKQKIIHLIE